jgi:ribokinase
VGVGAGAGPPAGPRHRGRDTTGAGDAFTAGLLAAWLPDRGIDPAAALDAGLALAADVVRRPGAR